MKKNEQSALVALSVAELNKQIAQTSKMLADWKVNRYSKQSKNQREGKLLRKRIAVLKTIVAQKGVNHG